jgi:hypothetical protein
MPTIEFFYCPACALKLDESSLSGRKWKSPRQSCPQCGSQLLLNKEALEYSWHDVIYDYVAPRSYLVTVLALFFLLPLVFDLELTQPLRSIVDLIGSLALGWGVSLFPSFIATFGIRAFVASRAMKGKSIPEWIDRLTVTGRGKAFLG